MLFQIPRLFRSVLPNGIVGNSLRSKQNSLLRILSVSYSQRLDPKLLIQNLAAEYPDAYGRKLMNLQRWLAAESSMSAALTHTPGVLDEDDILAIQCGIETNTLNETFEFLLEHNQKADITTATEILRNALGYVIAMLCFAILIVTFLMIFIVPTFAVMFEEFDLELPMLMTALIECSDLFGFLIPILLLAALGVGILLLFTDFRRMIRYSPLGRLLPAAAMRKSAGLLRLFALPTALGQPVAPTLTAAAQFHPDRRCRKRLLQARTQAISDADIWNQLASQGLISRNQGDQLGRIENPSLRAWTLGTLADRTRDQAMHKTEFLARIAQHAPVIVLGVFVGWIAVAVMQTLTNLIGSLA